MAIRFVTKPKPKSELAPAPKDAGKKFSLKAKPKAAPENVPGFKVLKEMNLSLDAKNRKFLIHRTKPDIWYEVVTFEVGQDSTVLKLRSPRGLVFDSNLDITTPKKYAVVVGPANVSEPPEAMMQQVRFGSEA